MWLVYRRNLTDYLKLFRRGLPNPTFTWIFEEPFWCLNSLLYYKYVCGKSYCLLSLCSFLFPCIVKTFGTLVLLKSEVIYNHSAFSTLVVFTFTSVTQWIVVRPFILLLPSTSLPLEYSIIQQFHILPLPLQFPCFLPSDLT